MLFCFVGTDLNLILQAYGCEGLKLVTLEETVSFGQSILKLTFDPGSQEAGPLTAECQLDHPFYVKNKGKKCTSCGHIFALNKVSTESTPYSLNQNVDDCK